MLKKVMRDNLFATKHDLVNWEFDHKVSEVFDDMILRSIPGYRLILELCTIVAIKYQQAHTNIYDLGCSTGSALLAIGNFKKDSVTMIAIDNSKPMLKKCKQNLSNITDCKFVCDDITNVKITNASVVILNFTMQFIKPNKRQQIINNIYQGLKEKGVLIMSEKLTITEPHSDIVNSLHTEFKKANGYSNLQIVNKRNMLENILITDSEKTHTSRLKKAGFKHYASIMQGLNFKTFIAIK